MCQPATASSLNCLVDDTADPVSEHIPHPYSQNAGRGLEVSRHQPLPPLVKGMATRD